jgi:hypothetical protein
MFFESLLVLAVLAVILVFFYRQAVKEFQILQTDSLDKAQGLLSERSPVVLLPAPTPQNLWTHTDLKQRPTLAKTSINGIPLRDALQRQTFSMRPDSAEALAKQVGITVWADQVLLPAFKTASWWTPMLLSRTEVAIGSQGLRQTYAYTTLLMATEGDLQVSLLNESSNPYLPAKWMGKRLSKMTRDDAPLLSQIQFVDVIVRPGSALLIPPHWKVCWESKSSSTPALAVWMELHHPVSWLAQKMAMRKIVQTK